MEMKLQLLILIHLRELSQKLETAKNSGDEKMYAKLQNAYDDYLTKFADAVSNQALKGEASWNGLDKDIRADLSKVRQATDKYRATLSQNINAAFTQGLDDIVEVLDKNIDLNVNHSALKEIKTNIDLQTTENMRLINEIRQRDADSKKGSGS